MIVSLTCIMISLLLAFYSFKNFDIFGSSLLLKKEHLNLDSSENIIKFNVEVPDHYAICFLGCKDLNLNNAKFYLEKSEEKINLNINSLKYSFLQDGQTGIEYFNFFAPEPGSYNLMIENAENINFFSSRLTSVKMILGSKKSNDISILIKKYNNPVKKILVLVSTIMSLMLLALGVILLLK